MLVAVVFTGCEKVIDVDLNTAPPRLVIDASINWVKGTPGTEQKIKLTTTTDYFSNVIPPATGAVVYITDSNQVQYDFTESTTTSGEYVCSNFAPVLNQDYTLTVIYKGETYTATETMKPVPSIDKIEQNNNGGISGEDIEIRTFFTDNPETVDFYLLKFGSSINAIPSFSAFDDQNIQGNQAYDVYFDPDLKAGDQLKISLSGVSQRYFNYMQKIISISGGQSGGPFSTPPATVRGNVINKTNENNFPLGYFNLSETDLVDYTVQ